MKRSEIFKHTIVSVIECNSIGTDFKLPILEVLYSEMSLAKWSEEAQEVKA